MGIGYNPKIVTNGLLACFDPGNVRSYPGSGTNIYDVSGNGYTGALVNGASHSLSNGGVFVLDGVNNYIDIPINLTTTNYTVFGAARYTAIGGGGRIFSAKNNNWLMGHYNNTTQNYYAEGWVANGGPSDTNWRIYAATGNISGDLYNFYVNGTLNAGPSSAGAAGPNGFAIGSYTGNYEFAAGHVGVLLVYNTILTHTQINQNFNATRGRYGI